MQSTIRSAETVTTSGASDKDFRPGRDLYIAIRQQFLGKETSLQEWCRANDVPRARATAAIFGTSNSDDARALRERILRAAGLIPSVQNGDER